MKKRVFSMLLVLCLCAALLPTAALADGSAQQEYDLANGSITVSVDADGKQYVTQVGGKQNELQTGETVISQTNNSTPTGNTVTITAVADKTAKVTLSGVNIVGASGDLSGTAGTAAVSTNGEGDVTVIISGNNTLESGLMHAGLEKGNAGKLTISGTSITTDSLTATGGGKGAGIGGGMGKGGSNITIIGCKVTAVSGYDAAGIGGGERGSGSNITILNANVTATGAAGAGIGGGYTYGYTADGTYITIENSTVIATGGRGAAGIGGGGSPTFDINGGSGSYIQITNSKVVAKGGSWGAGIGGGYNRTGENITISGSSQVSVQGGEESEDEISAGSAIGNGGIYNGSSSPLLTDGEPDTSGLTTAGWVKCYTPRANMKTDDPKDILYAPKITAGDNRSVTQGSQTELTFASDANYDAFQNVILDKESANQTELVNDENCTVKAGEDGSTIVTLKADLTASLAAGEHTLSIVSKNGTATATFRVVKKSSSNGSSRYAITVNETQNGSVSVSTKSASKGTTVTITTAPDKGYTLETLTVLDKNGEEIDLDIAAVGEKYTFKMPSGKVTVTATFMEDNTMLNYFVDVSAQDYFYDAVLWAAEKGITSGTDDSHFSPNAPCTRAQIVTFMWRAAGSPVVNYAMDMSDVSADAYYAEAVRWALSEDIATGTDASHFSPNAACTRAQAVTFIARAENGAQSSAGGAQVSDRDADDVSAGGSFFSDVKAGSYYTDPVAWAVENGVADGIGGGLFAPDDGCTRAQIVTFLYRAMAK